MTDKVHCRGYLPPKPQTFESSGKCILPNPSKSWQGLDMRKDQKRKTETD